MLYREEEYLPLSGIQHFSFCRRQWALIHIEQVWQENLLTIEGRILHEKAHGTDFREKRNELIITRGMAVSSAELGISGICDVVEFRLDPEGVELFGSEGKYLPVPIEYKRGKPKKDDSDKLQLCAQAMCLEEMLVCEIPRGFLYYGETRHRLEVPLDGRLRAEAKRMIAEMHELFDRCHTPKVRTGAFCRSCSINDVCLPKLCKGRSVSGYINERVGEEG